MFAEIMRTHCSVNVPVSEDGQLPDQPSLRLLLIEILWLLAWNGRAGRDGWDGIF